MITPTTLPLDHLRSVERYLIEQDFLSRGRALLAAGDVQGTVELLPYYAQRLADLDGPRHGVKERERAVPCKHCNRPTFQYHRVCEACGPETCKRCEP